MSTQRPGRRPRFTSPFAERRKAVLRTIARPFYWFRPTVRFALAFLTLSLLTTLLLARTHSTAPVDIYGEGDVVRGDVIAPADISVEDRANTERRRAEAVSAVLPVWNYYPARAESAPQSFRTYWAALEQQFESRAGAGGGVGAGGATQNGNRAGVRGDAAPDAAGFTWPGPEGEREAAARAVIAHNFDAATLVRLTRIFREAGGGYVYDEADAQQVQPEVRLVDAQSGSQTSLMTRGRFVPLTAARENLLASVRQLEDWTPGEREAIASVMVPLLMPNVAFDREATEAARRAAIEAVAPSVVTLKRNEVVAREGDTVSPQLLVRFAVLRDYGHTERRSQHFVGLFLLVAALYWAAWRFTEYRSTITSLRLSAARAYTLVCLSIFVQLLLMRASFFVAESIAEHSMYAPTNDVTIWGFAVPFAAGALLVAMLVDTQLALVTGVLSALFVGLIAPTGVLMACYALISSSAAIYGIGRYRERQSVTLAGLVVGAANAFAALAVIFAAQQPVTLNAVLLAAACGLAGGILTAVFTASALPVNESLFGILTDVKLLELSNADLPVLGQMALRAPGTNQHSHAVGQLAEEACRAIGANTLLARIGALYHDIGKLAAPEMFVENQAGVNPHDRLRPSQSARIITSHVTYGLKLAKEIGLPPQISAFIPEHHGTRTLHFFLRKAQAEAPEGETVNEAEFRYPGPKPQSKETAIMMLADSCEAAARSLARPDCNNIRVIVTKIFDAILSDGQLDECDLTLREVTKIRETMVASLTAIYHGRIDYPGFNPPSLDPAKTPLPPPDLDSEERGLGYSKPSEVPISKGGEVEDEALASKGKR